MINRVHYELRWLWDKKWFGVVISTLIFVNPLALAPQLWTTFTASNIEGVSMTMWVIFFFVQMAVMLEGISKKSTPIALSMFISMIESATIVVVLLIRT